MITQEELKKLVTYNYETGEMFWLPRPFEMFKSEQACKTWNTKFANKQIKTIDGKGYFHGLFLGKFLRVHRLSFLYFFGYLPKIIDHINGIKTDNRISNLKGSSIQKNNMNRSIGRNNTSGVVGVYKNNQSGLWCAQMKFKGETYHLGSSKNKSEVISLRKAEEKRLGFSERHGAKLC